MIYVLNGEETYRMAKRKDELLKKDGLLPENIVHFDLEKPQSILPVINACNTMSLFSDLRTVIVENPFFLNPSGKSLTDKKQKGLLIEQLTAYIENPNPDTDLIFYCFGFSMDGRKKEGKLLKNANGKGVRVLNYTNPKGYELEQILDDELMKHHIRMSREARNEFLLRINQSATELYRGMDKLVLYGEKMLELDDVCHLVSINTDVNIWKFQDALLARDANTTLRSIYEMMEISNMTPQGIMPLLAYRLKTVYQVVRCHECGLSNDEIKTKTKRYRPDLDLKSAHGRNSHDLLCMIKDLADLDQGIKTGVLNDRDGFEYYILKHLKPYGL